MIKVGIIGITGKIGVVLANIISVGDGANNENSNNNSGAFKLVGGVSRANIDHELEIITKNSDILIDFSSALACMRALEVACRCNIPFVSGTSGLSPEDFRKFEQSSKKIPIMYASNFSICIQLMCLLVRKCATILTDFDFSIVDRHHSKKKDAPSGTALLLAKQYQEASGNGRQPQIVSIRSGNVCGEHICDFCGEDEMLTISHLALNKKVFACGALRCAEWLVGKQPKLYGMSDFLEASGVLKGYTCG